MRVAWGAVSSAFGDALSQNEMMRGGLVLMVVAAALSQLYQAWCAATEWVRARFFFTVELYEHDEAFKWLLEWLCTNTEMMQHAPSVVVSTERKRATMGPANDRREQRCASQSLDSNHFDTRVRFEPANNSRYFLWHAGTLMCLVRSVVRPENTSTLSATTSGKFVASHSGVQRLRVTCLGRHAAVLRSLVCDVVERHSTKERDRTAVWMAVPTGYWVKTALKAVRPWDSVVIDERIKQSLLGDVEEFLRSESWYRDMGIPYRRGYLLEGDPGNGKTSLIAALAGRLNVNLCCVSLASSKLEDENLQRLFRNIPEPGILLIEDVDAAFRNASKTSTKTTTTLSSSSSSSRDDESDGSNRSNHSRDASAGVSFSGLLNCLDGVASSDGRIVVMTTNHRERLDPALIRPGRVDCEYHLPCASKEQVFRMFTRFFGGNGDNGDDDNDECNRLAETFAHDAFADNAIVINMATVQEFMLRNRNVAPCDVAQMGGDLRRLAAKRTRRARTLKSG